MSSVEDSSPKQNEVVKKKKTDTKGKTPKKKVNWWALKALIISFSLSFGVNVISNLALEDTHIFVAYIITIIIVVIGVFFDMIGTAATACDVQPFLSMAARRVKGAKTAVRLAVKRDTVSSVCCDIVGDICGVVSGVCAATIVSIQIGNDSFWLSILVYSVISTLTITLKALGKSYAVKQSTKILFSTAKVLSIFKREG